MLNDEVTDKVLAFLNEADQGQTVDELVCVQFLLFSHKLDRSSSSFSNSWTS